MIPPTDLETLREWARLHAEKGCQPWQMVADLLADYDRRGREIQSLTAQLALAGQAIEYMREKPI